MKNIPIRSRYKWRLLAGATLLAAQPTTAHSQNDVSEIGRVFYTAQERRALEQFSIRTETPTGPAETSKKEALRFNGVVRGQDGFTMAWINGRPLEHNDSAGWRPEIVLRGSDLVIVRDGKRAVLQAGETLGETPLPSLNKQSIKSQ